MILFDLIKEDAVKIGTLCETQRNVIVIDNISYHITNNEMKEIKEYANYRNLDILYSMDVINIENYYYLANGNSWINTDDYPIGEYDVIKGEYNIYDIINYYKNNIYCAIPIKFYYLLKKDFNKEGFTLQKETNIIEFDNRDLLPEEMYNQLKDKYEVIFVKLYSANFNIRYKVLTKPKQ